MKNLMLNMLRRVAVDQQWLQVNSWKPKVNKTKKIRKILPTNTSALEDTYYARF